MIPHVRRAYVVLMGRRSDDLPEQGCMGQVMEFWDGGRFDADPVLEFIARMALCQIGVRWEPEMPYSFELVAERLREIWSDLGTTPITKGRMELLLQWTPAPEGYQP